MLNNIAINNIKGWVSIRDAETKEYYLENESNGIHFGNIIPALSYAFLGDSNYFLNNMSFGNGATSVTQDGKVFYRSKNTANTYDPSAALYNVTYQKTLTNLASGTPDQDNNIDLTISDLGYVDINILCTLDYGEPSGQDLEATAEDTDAPFIFDEIAMKTDNGLLVSHVIFHPIQKALNRSIEVEYTIRIEMQ